MKTLFTFMALSLTSAVFAESFLDCNFKIINKVCTFCIHAKVLEESEKRVLMTLKDDTVSEITVDMSRVILNPKVNKEDKYRIYVFESDNRPEILVNEKEVDLITLPKKDQFKFNVLKTRQNYINIQSNSPNYKNFSLDKVIDANTFEGSIVTNSPIKFTCKLKSKEEVELEKQKAEGIEKLEEIKKAREAKRQEEQAATARSE